MQSISFMTVEESQDFPYISPSSFSRTVIPSIWGLSGALQIPKSADAQVYCREWHSTTGLRVHGGRAREYGGPTIVNQLNILTSEFFLLPKEFAAIRSISFMLYI